MIGERLGGKIKHGCDFWITYLALALTRRAPDVPQVRPGDRPGGRGLTLTGKTTALPAPRVCKPPGNMVDFFP